MKRIIIFFLVTILVFSMGACHNRTASEGKQGTLIVNGQATESPSIVYPEYATVSLCDVVSALGFELSWNGADNAFFYCNNTKYEICISQKTLIGEGENDNYLLSAPGNIHYVCEVVEDILIIDDNTLHSLFHTFIGFPIEIAIDYENNCVTITGK